MTGPVPEAAAATVEAAVDAYFAAWNERDAAARDALLDVAIADACELDGPTGTFRGRDAILRLIVSLQDRMGGAVTVRTGPVEMADGVIRFPWQVRTGGGDSLLGGVDVVEVATDGRLARIVVAI